MSLKDQAYDRIKSHLFANDGSQEVYSERQLAADLGLNLGPVRSAVERLRVAGLIVVVPKAGIFLPSLNAQAIRDFYEFRTVIETHIVAALAKRVSSVALDNVEEVVRAQERCVARRDPAGYHELDLAFHFALAELHGNKEMVGVLGQVRDKMHRIARRFNAQEPDRIATMTAQHRAILEAVRAGEGENAVRRLREHLEWGRDYILAAPAGTETVPGKG